jgi:hypothetical protein
MHDERYTAIPQLSVRDFVLLQREPENPEDANAILVKHKRSAARPHRRELASYLSARINNHDDAFRPR